MAEPFLAEIRIASFAFAPRGWALCNGQLLPINQNQALFSLLGTTYGGNGTVNFALPDLRGRSPIHMGGGFVQGQQGGEQAHTLSIAEIPAHSHTLQGASVAATTPVPTSNLPASVSAGIYCTPDTNLTTLAAASIAAVGGSQAHLNMQPFLVLSFFIALQGIFPSQT